VQNGEFLGDLNFSSFSNSSVSDGEFHPRGLVFARDRRTLYVTLFNEPTGYPLGGWVLSYDIVTGRVHVIASNDPSAPPSSGCAADLNAPDGVTIGRDQNLYVIGRANPNDPNATDKVLVLNPTTGGCRPLINLDQPGAQQPSYAQSLLFGPGGLLYLPIRGGGTDTGGVRAYDIYAHPVTYTLFVQPQQIGGEPADWWWLTFGKTDPTTLTYSP